ncbi:MAG: class IIb bacteriocin, lactobin A/cerein 7B family [Bacilli bacterium]|nr:class IIb bacteriocin, lactobin A/cerein 7B family [Bacilli bacterium]
MLTNEEMLSIDGGAVSWSLIGLIGGAITFIAGIIDGYLRPLKCN